MDKLKYVVIACGVAGLVASFLPTVEGGQSLFELREIDRSVFMIITAFALATVMGVVATLKGVQRWQSLIGVICFAFAIFKIRDHFFFLLQEGAAGGRIMAIGAAVGLLGAIALAVFARPASSSTS